MVEIYVCDQCESTHQKYITITKKSFQIRPNPNISIKLNVRWIISLRAGGRYIPLIITVTDNVIKIINSVNERRKAIEESEGDN